MNLENMDHVDLDEILEILAEMEDEEEWDGKYYTSLFDDIEDAEERMYPNSPKIAIDNPF